MTGRWWEYVYPYFAISLILNVILIVVVSKNAGGVLGAASIVMAEPQSGSAFIVIFLFLGPLFNVYTSIVSAKSAIEADDDYFHFNDEFDMPQIPSPVVRRRLIFALSFLTGLIFLPFAFWLYTAKIGFLWALDLPLFIQPGALISLFLISAAYFVVPKVFPNSARHMSELETLATEHLERMSNDT